MDDNMDFFEMMPEEILIHVLTFCDGKDLLNLMEMNSNFKSIICSEVKLMKKIRLVVNFEKVLVINEILEMVQNRKFVTVELYNVKSAMHSDDMVPIAMPIFELLSETVNDLTLEGKVWNPILERLLRLFLPKLKNCIVKIPRCDPGLAEAVNSQLNTLEIASRGSPLKTLRIESTSTPLLDNFFGCHQIETFELEVSTDSCGCNECLEVAVELFQVEKIGKFLHQLPNLKVLRIDAYLSTLVDTTWIQMPFQLQELRLKTLVASDEHHFIKFLKRQKSLKNISVGSDHSYYEEYDDDDLTEQLLETFCDLPLLTELDMGNFHCNPLYYDDIGEMSNSSVKTLIVWQEFWIEKLKRIFTAADKIIFENSSFYYNEELFGVLDEIEINADELSFRCYLSKVTELPDNFEHDILKFFERNSKSIKSVTIGYESWRLTNIQLPLEFCKNLILCLPNLKYLTLYNVDDVNFRAFLFENGKVLQSLELNGVSHPNRA